MIKGDYIILAQGASLDNRNRLTIQGIADQLTAPQVPVAMQEVTVVGKIRSVGEVWLNRTMRTKVSFKIEGEEVAKAEIAPKITIEKNKSWAPIFQISQLIFPKFGNYDVILYADGRKVAETSMTVLDEAVYEEK